jgi:hypothetical protein
MAVDVYLDAEEPDHAEDVVKEIVLDAIRESGRTLRHKTLWCHAIKQEDE